MPERRVLLEAITRPLEAGRRAPPMEGVPTGVPGLDPLFYTTAITPDGEVKTVPLGDIPRGAVFNVAGVSDTGKSLLVEQFAITQAKRGERVAFITVESPAAFLARGLLLRARAMGVSEEVVEEGIIVLDAASHSLLREDIPSLLDTLAHVISEYETQHVVVDSVTGLYEHREMQARMVVRAIFNFLKKWRQTALLVSQKRSGHDPMSPEVAGGYAVAHILDGTLVLHKEIIDSAYKERLYRVPMGEVVRLIRIDGCRLSGHDTQTHILHIGKDGLVRVGPSLREMKGGGK